MRKPLVSIIVPVYKVESYLRRCLDSVISQTYVNLEIILVDDGSPDNCPQICDEYAEKDKRVVVIHKKNGGLSDARNAGLDICKGEYISFVDSDDWIDRDFVKILINVILCERADIAFANFKRVSDEKPCKRYTVSKSNNPIEVLDGKVAFRRLLSENGTSLVIAWGKLYKKLLFENVRFPIGLLHEDEYTTYKLLCSSSRIVFLDIPLYFYFQREDSIMGTAKSSSIRALRAKVERYNFIKQHEFLDLKELCLKNLCWELLFAYSKKNLDEKRIGYSSRDGVLNHLRQCQRDHWKSAAPLMEKLILKFLVSFPVFYVVYQKISPLKIRKI